MNNYNAMISSSQAITKKKPKKPNRKSHVDKQIETEILNDDSETDEEVPALPPPLNLP